MIFITVFIFLDPGSWLGTHKCWVEVLRMYILFVMFWGTISDGILELLLASYQGIIPGFSNNYSSVLDTILGTKGNILTNMYYLSPWYKNKNSWFAFRKTILFFYNIYDDSYEISV